MDFLICCYAACIAEPQATIYLLDLLRYRWLRFRALI